LGSGQQPLKAGENFISNVIFDVTEFVSRGIWNTELVVGYLKDGQTAVSIIEISARFDSSYKLVLIPHEINYMKGESKTRKIEVFSPNWIQDFLEISCQSKANTIFTCTFSKSDTTAFPAIKGYSKLGDFYINFLPNLPDGVSHHHVKVIASGLRESSQEIPITVRNYQ